MEVVATREIQPDEEVFISYGKAWDDAWNQYVNDWTPGPEGGIYASSEELNANLEWIRTNKDQYPYSNAGEIIHICFVALGDPIEGRQGTYIWDTEEKFFDMSEYVWKCEIDEIEQHKNHTYMDSWDRQDSVKPVDLTYTIIIDLDDGNNGKARILNVPRKAIRFIDTRYNSDNYRRGTFRHAIHLPEDMVLSAWRDLK